MCVQRILCVRCTVQEKGDSKVNKNRRIYATCMGRLKMWLFFLQNYWCMIVCIHFSVFSWSANYYCTANRMEKSRCTKTPKWSEIFDSEYKMEPLDSKKRNRTTKKIAFSSLSMKSLSNSNERFFFSFHSLFYLIQLKCLDQVCRFN